MASNGWRSATLAVTIYLAASGVCWAQTTAPAKTPATASPSPSTSAAAAPPRAANAVPSSAPPPVPDPLHVQIADLQKRQADLGWFVGLVLVPMAVLTAILAAGGLIGIVFSFRNEARSGQAHDLFVRGEMSQQVRAEDIHTVLLEASQKTLTLVNDTLELARNASDQAAKQLSQRAEKVRDETSEEATDLFVNAHYHQDFKSRLLKIVVEEPTIRGDILDLAQRLASIEGYLEFQQIKMTAPGFLVKGMAHHLRQDEARAIKFLARAAETRDVNPKVTQFAYYWTGYACNNAGRFSQAGEVFAIARRFADEKSALFFELMRLEEESRFFDLTHRYFVGDSSVTGEAMRIVGRLGAHAENAIKAEVMGVAEGIATTQGNICIWLARTGADGEGAERLDEAIKHFRNGGSNLWARFGCLEAERERTPGALPATAAYAELEKIANVQSQRRAEPRSLTLLYLTTVLCMKGQNKPESEVLTVTQLLRKAFADVDDSLTIYSQRWKTNIAKKRFESDDLGPAVGDTTIGAS